MTSSVWEEVPGMLTGLPFYGGNAHAPLPTTSCAWPLHQNAPILASSNRLWYLTHLRKMFAGLAADTGLRSQH